MSMDEIQPTIQALVRHTSIHTYRKTAYQKWLSHIQGVCKAIKILGSSQYFLIYSGTTFEVKGAKLQIFN
jgi:hypothetical protein